MRRAVVRLAPLAGPRAGGRQPRAPAPVRGADGGGRPTAPASRSLRPRSSPRSRGDRLMARLALDHPGYGWERNAGYGTAEHQAGLARLGVTAHAPTVLSPPSASAWSVAREPPGRRRRPHRSPARHSLLGRTPLRLRDRLGRGSAPTSARGTEGRPPAASRSAASSTGRTGWRPPRTALPMCAAQLMGWLVRRSRPRALQPAGSPAARCQPRGTLARGPRLRPDRRSSATTMRRRCRGRGSAVFLHVAQPDYAPTAGCVAVALGDLLTILAGMERRTWLSVPPCGRPARSAARGAP